MPKRRSRPNKTSGKQLRKAAKYQQPSEDPIPSAPPPQSTMKLPPELLRLVVRFLDRKTQISMLCASKETYKLVAPVMYERVTLTSENAWAFFKGMIRKCCHRRRNDQYNYDERYTTLSEEDFRVLDNGDRVTDEGVNDQPIIGWPKAAWFEPQDEDWLEDEPIVLNIQEDHPRPYVATYETHQRKLALIPQTPRRRPLWDSFSKPVHVVHGSEAYWELARWVSLHEDEVEDTGDQEDDRPPFLRAVSASSRPTHFCYKVPECNTTRYEDWLATAWEGRQMSSQFKDEEKYLNLVARFLNESAMRSCQSITIHGSQISELPFGVKSVRIFLPTDYCRTDGPWGRPKDKKVHKLHERLIRDMTKDICAFRNHTLWNFRAKDYYEEDNRPRPHRRKIERWDFVCYPIALHDDHESDSSSDAESLTSESTSFSTSNQTLEWWAALNERITKRRPQWAQEDVGFAVWADAPPCICCGRK
ncbi:hypothetical protein IAT40_006367 [Kwoniella sp. CBS 6097]